MKDTLPPDPSDEHGTDGATETAFLLPTIKESGEPVETDFTPGEQHALHILEIVLGHRERAREERSLQLLEDEAQLIKSAARNLTGVSAAVMSSLAEEHYWHVPLNQIVPWGQGPVLTAIAARRSFKG